MIRTLMLVLTLALPLSASAAARALNDVNVANVKLENYPSADGRGVTLWFVPGSTCTNGKISFGTNASTADGDRLWSVVTAAKLSGKKVFLIFEDTSPQCTLVSFGLSS